IRDEMNRFFMNPDRPVVLALCRPDQRKNISGLIKAYGEDMELQAMANLAIFAGIRKDISDKEENERAVLTDMLLLMDKYDLYGKMAIPKKHDFEWEVPELYRIAAEKRGVFANVAFTEPFGLTLIEASGTGLPIVATDDGGPRDIMSNCKNGILVDVTDTKSISEAIKEIIVNPEKWKEYSQNGILNVREYYSWDSHVESYLNELSKLPTEDVKKTFSTKGMQQSIGKRLTSLSYLLVTDIDYTLIGGDNEYLDELKQLLDENSEYIGFGVATGRTIESALEVLKEHEISQPDLIISSVGTEIYYGASLKYDQGYDAHISKRWNREKIRSILEKFDFLTYQEEDTQRKFKVSYYMEPRKDSLAKVHDALMKNKIRYNLIYSHDQFLDILPSAASKGKAIRYLSYKWEIPQDHMVVSGDSGNDEEMLRGDPLGVVVGNYSSELERLKGMNRVYFAEREFAGGIIEGIRYYKIMEKAKGEV
ncbi:MAG TPA: HAD-IIB family hydrolase, partial [Spirochaetota bacterium]|nr:HAD-IIB family hydrolase [Spirochaetota bacterium]